MTYNPNHDRTDWRALSTRTLIEADTLHREAALIAAAPDMLAALYKAQVSLCDAWSPRDKQALAAVNAAIAKATGEETEA